MVFIPERTTINIIGGQALAAGANPLLISPPWAGEDALCVVTHVTATVGTGIHLLYGAVDGVVVLQGNANLTQEDHGFVYALNGPGTLPLTPFPMRVSTKITLIPAPAGGGSIYLHYYWERLNVPSIPATSITLPLIRDREMVEERRARQEKVLWSEEKPLKPAELLRQEEQELSPMEKKRRHLLNLALQDPKFHKKSWLE